MKTQLARLDKEAPSIAVLPFVDTSGDEKNEYFADGLAEELLNVLAKILGLCVASRTSAFSFKGGLDRLYEAIEKGFLPQDASLQERVYAHQTRRQNILIEMGGLQGRAGMPLQAPKPRQTDVVARV